MKAPIILSILFYYFNFVLSSYFKKSYILQSSYFKNYIMEFNKNDLELYTQYIKNKDALSFLSSNIPIFECPDKEIERTYYFRWWIYRKHIKFIKSEKKEFFVITEFLPEVSWAGKYNTISCAAAHHIREGRWLHNATFLDDYSRFWLREANLRQYSFWISYSLLSRSMVSGDLNILKELLPNLLQNFAAIEKTNLQTKAGQKGLYFNTDNRDGMESSIGGKAGRSYRPTLNSYQFGEAKALSIISSYFINFKKYSNYFKNESLRLKSLIEHHLWDEKDNFFKVLPFKPNSKLVDVRELHGYTPWYFNLPAANRSIAWLQVIDNKGFSAPYGLTTAEQRHPKFKIDYNSSHECLWDGPIWPYATSITLTAMANHLNRRNIRRYVTSSDYYAALLTYARSHTRREGSGAVDWIDENQDPYTGVWVAREILQRWRSELQGNRTLLSRLARLKGGQERGKDYNHGTFVDLVLSGLVGIRPLSREALLLRPLLPADRWSYFCVDQLLYHGRYIAIVWDQTGARYGDRLAALGAPPQGLHVFVDGVLAGSRRRLGSLKIQLPPRTAN